MARWYAGYAGWDRPGAWFVADDQTADSEARIVSGLTKAQAVRIAERHNMAIGEQPPRELTSSLIVTSGSDGVATILVRSGED